MPALGQVGHDQLLFYLLVSRTLRISARVDDPRKVASAIVSAMDLCV
jgi:hypothetical protein